MAPSLVLITPDGALANRLREHFPAGCDVQVFRSLGAAEQALRGVVPAAFLADFRQAAHGGHQEAGFLEKLVGMCATTGVERGRGRRAEDPGRNTLDPRPTTLDPQRPRVVLLTSPECPEPLVRVAVSSDCRCFREPVSDDLLAESLLPSAEGGKVEGGGRRVQGEIPSTLDPRPSTPNAEEGRGISHSAFRIPHSELTVESRKSKVERKTTLNSQLSTLNSQLSSPPPPCAELRGSTRVFTTHSPALAPMLGDLEVAARHDVALLVIGETGSGKTFLSHVLHELSSRRDERFGVVACGALPPDLIESELFGHVKGAFTGAHADKEGKFAAAGRGTLLLDEIDVLGLDQQAKLLRVIETGEYEPVGSNETRHSEARLIVASNQELEPLAEAGRFRPDLYYRLNVLKFTLPPLRERPEDIVALTVQFIERFREAHNVEVREIDPPFLKAVETYGWPGNVRELENTIRRAVIFCRGGRLTLDQLPPNVVQAYVAGNVRPACRPGPSPSGRAQPASLEQKVALTEREIIEAALRKNNYRRTATARDLGISRVTLYNKMKKYGVAG